MSFRALPSFARRRATGRVVATCLTTLTFIGCGGGNRLVNPINRGGNITIEISRSTVPVFKWADQQPVQGIVVYDFNASGAVDQVLWGYGNVSIVPPVTYGKPIAGGVDLGGGRAAAPLLSGERYRVEVVRDGQRSFVDWIVP